MAKLTDKQKIFASEYLKDFNATRAYKKVYKKVKKDETAKAAGSRLLTNVNVKKYINEKIKSIEDANIADAKEVMQYLTKGMRMKLDEEVVVTENVGDYMSEARIIRKQISIKDANKCAELLGKRYKLFIDKVEQKIDANVNSTKKLDSILEQLNGGESNE